MFLNTREMGLVLLKVSHLIRSSYDGSEWNHSICNSENPLLRSCPPPGGPSPGLISRSAWPGFPKPLDLAVSSINLRILWQNLTSQLDGKASSANFGVLHVETYGVCPGLRNACR